MMTGAHTQNRREGAASEPSHSRSAERAALSDESAELSAGTVGTLHAEAMSAVRGGRRPAGLRFCGAPLELTQSCATLSSCRVPTCPPSSAAAGAACRCVIVLPIHRAKIAAIRMSAPKS